jgi:hypothetical protein
MFDPTNRKTYPKVIALVQVRCADDVSHLEDLKQASSGSPGSRNVTCQTSRRTNCIKILWFALVYRFMLASFDEHKAKVIRKLVPALSR